MRIRKCENSIVWMPYILVRASKCVISFSIHVFICKIEYRIIKNLCICYRMARFRKYRNRRKGRGRRRNYRRRRSVKRTSLQKVYNFKRVTVEALDVIDTQQNYARYFSLNALHEVSDYTNLFDQYRIAALRVEFQFDKTGGEVGTVTPMPMLSSVIDYDDYTALVDENDYLQYSTYKRTPLNYRHKRYFKPRVAGALYQAVGTGYSNLRSPWIDCASTSVQHYGIKFMTDGSQNGGIGNTTLGHLRVYTTYYVQFRNCD